jgi:hypothetical protein
VGPEYIVATIGIDFVDDVPAGEIERTVLELETKIKSRIPEVKKVFIEAEGWRGPAFKNVTPARTKNSNNAKKGGNGHVEVGFHIFHRFTNRRNFRICRYSVSRSRHCKISLLSLPDLRSRLADNRTRHWEQNHPLAVGSNSGKFWLQPRPAGLDALRRLRDKCENAISFRPERVLFRPCCVNLQACLCGVPMYTSAQSLDFLAWTKNSSFPNRKPTVSHPEFPDGN